MIYNAEKRDLLKSFPPVWSSSTWRQAIKPLMQTLKSSELFNFGYTSASIIQIVGLINYCELDLHTMDEHPFSKTKTLPQFCFLLSRELTTTTFYLEDSPRCFCEAIYCFVFFSSLVDPVTLTKVSALHFAPLSIITRRFIFCVFALFISAWNTLKCDQTWHTWSSNCVVHQPLYD